MNTGFLKKLKQKLQVGNTRSIHLNSYPGRLAARLDLFELSNIRQNLPQDFLKKLLSNPLFDFKFKIEQSQIPYFSELPSSQESRQGEPAPEHKPPAQNAFAPDKKEIAAKQALISKRLSAVYYENEDTYLEHGIKTFGFGYPTLVYQSKNDPGKVLSAPVFIWMLELTRDRNEWIISRDEEQGISINDVLLNFLEQDLGSAGFSKLNDEYLSDSLIDQTEFELIINRLLSQISSSANPVTGVHSVTPMLDKAARIEYLRKHENPSVIYSGIFGLFKTPKEPLIRDIKHLIENEDNLQFDHLNIDKYQEYKYSAVETDPTQEHALKSLGSSSKLIIHGPPGTGKSQTLTAIIVNALFNEAKCLVVCEKRTALEVILKNLTVLGLGSLCGLIEDVNRDRKKIVDAVRDRGTGIRPVRRSILDKIFHETDHAVELINNNHSFYSRYLINDMTWGDLVGKFINEKGENENYLRLYNELRNLDIDFESDSISELYNSTLNCINKNRKLFKTAKADLETFMILNDAVLTDRSVKDIVMDLEKRIKILLSQMRNSIDLLKTLNEKYSSGLSSYFADYYRRFNSAITVIAGMYNRNYAINRSLFTENKGWSNFKLSIAALFSKKYKQLKIDKKEIVRLFYGLREFQKNGYFEFQTDEISVDLSAIRPGVEAIGNALNNWYSGINDFKEKHFSEYSVAAYDKFAFGDTDLLITADSAAEKSLETINDSGILAGKHNGKYKFENSSIAHKLSVISGIAAGLELIVKDISLLYDYFYWRNDYLGCNREAQKIIDRLIEYDDNNWELSAELFFVFNSLVVNEKNIQLRDDTLFEEVTGNLGKIREFQLDIILEHWKKRQAESAVKFEERTGININALYNKSRNSRYQKRNSLRKIIAADQDLFTDHFPVMLVNPVVCSSLFEMREGMFDLVIFDEASQLRVEDVYAAKLRGKHRIVSGDENQMPPSSYFASSQLVIDSDTMSEDEEETEITIDPGNLADAESLLEFAIRRGYNESFLDIHYRSKHPDLIDFSNAAFYNSRLNPMPPVTNYKAIRYFNVCGIYDQTEGVNKQEAEKVISLINELIIPEKGDDNPSIGVATFNILQRNYILDMINSAANSDSGFAQKISIIRNKTSEPFFVKNLENIQGDERDIIIISTTFGRRADGSFIQNFGPVNQEKGYRLLNVIITRAKLMMAVCTSIPDEYISGFPGLLAESGNKGKGVFYAYLAYAKAIEQYDPKSRQSVIEQLMANSEKIENRFNRNTNTRFESEVYNCIRSYIPSERLVVNFSTGGFLVDIAVLPVEKSGRIIAIECDGSSFHNSPEAYAWDIFRGKYLEKFGMKFIRIWSVNWWNNHERELERLLALIKDAE